MFVSVFPAPLLTYGATNIAKRVHFRNGGEGGIETDVLETRSYIKLDTISFRSFSHPKIPSPLKPVAPNIPYKSPFGSKRNFLTPFLAACGVPTLDVPFKNRISNQSSHVLPSEPALRATILPSEPAQYVT